MVAITSQPAFVAPRPRRAPRPRTAVPHLEAVPARRPVAVVSVEALRRPLLSAVLVVVALLAVAGLVLSEPLAEPGTVRVDGTHVVTAGETMWSIALDQAPAGEAAGYVERLVAVNGGAIVVPGQVLELPAP